jgi:2-polyprenyl-3-methyl-5-hydroxy-6-metoxy-1,4-benzoquinol methylase
MSESKEWKEAQEWERLWHGNCANSLNEELKQMVYAKRMGLSFYDDVRTPYNIILQNASILDIGGGAYSLLLKSSGFSEAVVVDPCKFPDWVYARYDAAGIKYIIKPAEGLTLNRYFDEVWLYNCLQHVIDPAEVVKIARTYSTIIRVFEWLDVPETDGHLHVLTENKMNSWLGGNGKTELLNESGCVGRAYYGIFMGSQYGK